MTMAMRWETVAVFRGIFPASIEVAPYSPIALAKVRIVPDAMPGPADGMTTFQNIFISDMPSVLPAYTRFTSICSKAALALRYISGKAITVAAIIHPNQDCTTFMLKVSYRKLPRGLRLLNRISRKKPATVGGSTSGSVRMPSSTDFAAGPRLITLLAANIPKKNEMAVATAPVFREIHSGLQSSFPRISVNSFIVESRFPPDGSQGESRGRFSMTHLR